MAREDLEAFLNLNDTLFHCVYQDKLKTKTIKEILKEVFECKLTRKYAGQNQENFTSAAHYYLLELHRPNDAIAIVAIEFQNKIPVIDYTINIGEEYNSTTVQPIDPDVKHEEIFLNHNHDYQKKS